MNTDWEADYWNGVNPAGYSRPQHRIPTMDMDRAPAERQPEVWQQRAFDMLNQNSMHNLVVLEIGCGFGFMVEDLIDFGVDAYGIDISTYAINAAKARRPDLASRFTVADARTHLATYARNAWDWIYSRDFVSCLTDPELNTVLSDGRAAARNQIHLFRSTDPAPYYNPHTGAEYVALRPNPNIRFVDMNTGAIY